jgi:hypothetical protein
MQILWLIVVVLLIAWLAGVGGVYSIGYYVHIFLILAIIALLLAVIRGRRVL